MTTETIEAVDKVLMNFLIQLGSCANVNSVNKLYRQARVWTRWEYAMAGRLSREEQSYVNKQLSMIRAERSRELREEAYGVDNEEEIKYDERKER